MPIPIHEAVREEAEAGEDKTAELRIPLAYGLHTMLGGVYVGIAVVLMLTAIGPLDADDHPLTRLLQGLVFGIALTLVIFAGAELSTGNMMVSIMGLFDRIRGPGVGGVAAIIVVSFVGNLVGAIVLSLLVYGSGVLELNASGGAPPPALTSLASVTETKIDADITTLVLRGLLCNMLVTLGVWMAARTRSDVAKMILVGWVLLAFVATGFDHVVANMTILALAMLAGVPGVTVGVFASNMLWVGLGNLVGGGLVGAIYGYLGRAHQEEPAPDRTTTEARLAQS